MSRVFTSSSTDADVYVFSDDHCPPHVHAKHRGDGWIARIQFSFVGKEVQLLSIAALRNTPLQRTVNRLLNDIEAELPACRKSWWAIRRTTCLANQWAVVSAPGWLEVLPKAAPNAQQITEATYDPKEEHLRVTFHDGTTRDVSTRQ